MVKVEYLVKVNGKKGSLKMGTNYAAATAKAEQVGGYVKTVYKGIDREPIVPLKGSRPYQIWQAAGLV